MQSTDLNLFFLYTTTILKILQTILDCLILWMIFSWKMTCSFNEFQFVHTYVDLPKMPIRRKSLPKFPFVCHDFTTLKQFASIECLISWVAPKRDLLPISSFFFHSDPTFLPTLSSYTAYISQASKPRPTTACYHLQI